MKAIRNVFDEMEQKYSGGNDNLNQHFARFLTILTFYRHAIAFVDAYQGEMEMVEVECCKIKNGTAGLNGACRVHKCLKGFEPQLCEWATFYVISFSCSGK